MRVLFTSLPIQSHVLPALIPAALACRAAGHEVAVATGTAITALVERCGIEAIPLRDVRAPGELNVPMPPWRPERTGPLNVPLFDEAGTVRFARNLLETRWRPDVIVRETNEYAGRLVAEAWGVPHTVLDIAPLINELIPDLEGRLDDVRGLLGLGGTPGERTAGLVPDAWYRTTDSGRRCYRVPGAAPRTEAKHVFASFGTTTHWLLHDESELMKITVEALGRQSTDAIVALGSQKALDNWDGPRPGNVRLEAFPHQRELLRTSDVFLTHAGFGGVREALEAGVPMVALPLFADQPANAKRIAELGVGEHIPAAGITAETLAEAIETVRHDPMYRHNARAKAEEIEELPDLTEFADSL